MFCIDCGVSLRALCRRWGMGRSLFVAADGISGNCRDSCLFQVWFTNINLRCAPPDVL
jgi:hypothetical protein